MLGSAHSWFDRHPTAGDTALAAVVMAPALTTFANVRYASYRRRYRD